MKNILLLAYAVSPYRGSEYAVAWNHILNMSKDNKITVIYGTSGNHMGDFDEMNKFLSENKVENVNFVQVKPSKKTTALNFLNVKNIFNYSFYWAYNSWQIQVLDTVKQLMLQNKYDLIHFLCPIGYREPGYLWKLDVPYMWGPICGVNNVPWKLFKILTIKGKIRFLIRNVVNTMQFALSFRLRKALKGVDVLLTATTETKDKFDRICKNESIYIPENCLLVSPVLNSEKFKIENGKFQILFVGRLDDGKGCILFLKALMHVKRKELINVNILGDGPLKGQLEDFVLNNGLKDIVTFHGSMPRTEVMRMFDTSHLHVITSLSEANTTVVWEAMAHGVPTLALDHCGMHDTICEKCGIKIPVENSEQIVADIAKEINELLDAPSRFESLAYGTLECAQKYVWDARRKAMNSFYDLAIERYNKSTRC